MVLAVGLAVPVLAKIKIGSFSSSLEKSTGQICEFSHSRLPREREGNFCLINLTFAAVCSQPQSQFSDFSIGDFETDGLAINQAIGNKVRFDIHSVEAPTVECGVPAARVPGAFQCMHSPALWTLFV